MDEYGFAKEVFLESVDEDRAVDDPLQWVTSIFTASKQVCFLSTHSLALLRFYP